MTRPVTNHKRGGDVPPNLSKYIDPSNCEKCGALCCKQFSMFYSKSEPRVVLSEVDRLKLLFEDEVEVVDHIHNVEIIFKKPCPQLDENNKCKIYYDRKLRPLLCRMYPYKNTFDCPYMTKKGDVK